jgi:hypothetical protein
LNCDCSRSLGTIAAAVLLGLCAAACDVPLAPGYHILKESCEVRFAPGQPAGLEVRARYTVENTGTADLTFVDANVPRERTFGRTNIKVEIDGRTASAASLPAEDAYARPDALRIGFDPVWDRKQKREIAIEYTLRSPEDAGSRITIGERSFHLGARGWLPELLPPKRVLSPYPNPPKLSEFAVRVPSDFLVLASGVPKGVKKTSDESEHRFLLDPAMLGAAYVVAGKYATWPAGRKDNATVFWTLQPLKDDPSAGAQQIDSVWNVLEKDFGPLDKKISGAHVVESPELRGRFGDETGPAAVAFPAGVLVNPAALALGTDSEPFLDVVSRALAREWFGESMYFSDAAAIGLGEGLPEYAAIVIEEARHGADARRKRVTEYLRRYDEASKAATETPLSGVTLGDAAGPRRIALAKAALFFVALEDACGESPMRAGLANLLATERGREAGYADLRSALEQTCHQDFAPMFRLWLNSTGIPQDFREKYQGSATGEVAEAIDRPRF